MSVSRDSGLSCGILFLVTISTQILEIILNESQSTTIRNVGYTCKENLYQQGNPDFLNN